MIATRLYLHAPDNLAARVTADLHRWLFDEYLGPRLEKVARGEFAREEAQASATITSREQHCLDSTTNFRYNGKFV